jgi:hypothetical protein
MAVNYQGKSFVTFTSYKNTSAIYYGTHFFEGFNTTVSYSRYLRYLKDKNIAVIYCGTCLFYG